MTESIPSPEPTEAITSEQVIDESVDELKESFDKVKDSLTPTIVVAQVASFMVGSGTAKIVKSVLENNMADADLTRYGKATVVAASAVIGMMAKDATKSYAEEKTRKYARMVSNLSNSVKSGVEKAKTAMDDPEKPSA